MVLDMFLPQYVNIDDLGNNLKLFFRVNDIYRDIEILIGGLMEGS